MTPRCPMRKKRRKTAMSEAKNTGKSSDSFFTRFLEDNRRVFLFSVIVAIICWCGVSMYQTQDTEKIIKNVRVQIPVEGSLAANNGLKVFGEQDYFVDVTVRGKSYLLNDDGVADKINLTASLASVSSAGKYNLPISHSISEKGIEITNLSKTYISVYFDELVTKEFDLVCEVNKGDKFAVAEGFKLGEPSLNVEKIKLKGPALEINRITSVKAVATVDKELFGTESFEAEIVPVGSSGGADFSHVSAADDAKVYVVMTLSYSMDVTPTVTFTNAPKNYRDGDVKYTVTPDKAKITVASNEVQHIKDDGLSVGSIDFKDINNTLNTFTFKTDDIKCNFEDGIKSFTVTVDMSGMQKRWMEIPVEKGDAKLPDGAEIITKTIQSVQIIGPDASVMNIDSSAAYAVPDPENVELKKGENIVPAKIVLRTLTDSWVRGDYSVVIIVK